MTCKPNKLGQTDLVLGYVHAGLQVSTYSVYDSVTLVNTETHTHIQRERQFLTGYTISSAR